ncbi:MAG: helix-turn-helix transcriptional regulator [Sulfurimonadaceae bacterium]
MEYDFSQPNIMHVYKVIGKNVKAIREKNNLTQLDLSYKMGYKSVSLVSSAELCTKGKHFNIEHLYKISKICGVSLSDFFVGIE